MPGPLGPSARRGVVLVGLMAAAVALSSCGTRTDSVLDGPIPGEALSGTVTVLAAASLTESFDAIAQAFEGEHPGVEVVLSYGGSSALAEQIITGGIPADVFAAANESTMATVVDADLARRPTLFATNTLALAVPTGNPAQITGLADLARPELAIALCDHAVPCGAATDQLLALAGVTAAPDTLEPDVKSVLTRVALGEADAGLVYVTDVVAARGQVEGVAVPEASDVVNVYPIALLTEAPNAQVAAAFVAYVLSPEGQRILARAGFGSP